MPLPNSSAQYAAQKERDGLFADAARHWRQASRRATGNNFTWYQLRAEFCAGMARRAAIKDPQK